ncbi:hypothetical protein VNO80_17832 [Phaseolus coccineus]|uniref:Uncharacterized protein n=1 Tax=Phaseolus coccineus TaxID=3886 RepID=A0AAN9MD76_PHACN
MGAGAAKLILSHGDLQRTGYTLPALLLSGLLRIVHFLWLAFYGHLPTNSFRPFWHVLIVVCWILWNARKKAIFEDMAGNKYDPNSTLTFQPACAEHINHVTTSKKSGNNPSKIWSNSTLIRAPLEGLYVTIVEIVSHALLEVAGLQRFLEQSFLPYIMVSNKCGIMGFIL